MASDTNGRTLEIAQEIRQQYEAQVAAGQALPDSFEIFIMKPARNERRIKWNYKVITQDGPGVRMGQRELTIF